MNEFGVIRDSDSHNADIIGSWICGPMEVGLFPISADTDEEFLTTIRLTTYETHPYTIKVCESKDYIDNILKKYENK